MVACLWVRQEAVIQVMEALAQMRAVMETGGLMDLEVQVTVETAVLEAMEAREAMEAETSQTGMVARVAMEVVVMMDREMEAIEVLEAMEVEVTLPLTYQVVMEVKEALEDGKTTTHFSMVYLGINYLHISMRGLDLFTVETMLAGLWK